MPSLPSIAVATHAYRRLATNFAEAYQLGRLADALRQGPGDAVQATYNDWLAATDLSTWEREDLRRLGLPHAIEFDPQARIPMACWTEIPEDAGMIPLEADALLKHYPVGPTRVFLVRKLEDFPAGSREITITDPGHVAAANVVDVLRGQLDDLQRHRGQLSDRDAYAAVQELGSLYQAAASIALKSLAMDQYVQWDSQLPTLVAYEAIPSAVERHAATMVSHRAIALHLCAKAFGRESDIAERVIERTGQSILDVMHARVTQARANLQELLTAMNNALVRQVGAPNVPMALHVALRTSRDGGPAIVLVPPQSGAEVRPLAV